MHQSQPTSLPDFYIAGINYRKSDASIRGQFAVSDEQYQRIIKRASSFGITQFFILSTCNRTEIYAFAADPMDVCSLLTSETSGSKETFLSLAYIKNGMAAIEHMYNVAAGLDSQILGDYEIISQIKQSVKLPKQHNFLGCILERMVNEVLQCSKKIRSNTSISGGTVSVSFAAIQYIKSFYAGKSNRKLLLIGSGKFGSNTCKNISDYLKDFDVTIVNRTPEKAIALASQYNFNSAPIEKLQLCIDDADVILVATSAEEPVILKEHVTVGSKLIIDLSVPCNVDPQVGSISGVTLVNVDQLSLIKDETLQMRAKEIPLAQTIIAEHILDFVEWHHMRQHVPVLKAVKSKLLTLQRDNNSDTDVISICPVTQRTTEERIQKVINGMAVKMKTRNEKGCNYIEAINDFITPASN